LRAPHIEGATSPAAGIAIIAFGISLAGGRYVYKRLRWNNEAKEKEFKQQFVVHVTKKQQMIVDLTSTNYSRQVEQ
jgi:hypothetical protein